MAATGKNNQGKNDSKRNNLKKNATDFKEKISNGEPMRLNKFLSDAGVCSRRQADRYVEQGRILVDGEPAQMGQKVHAGQDIRVDGKRVSVSRKQIVLAVNKPKGIVCTTTDKDRAENIVDFLGYPERIYPVGRLDKDSEGLLLMTNQGDLVNKIMRSGNAHEKEYIVTIDKPVTERFLEQMAGGIRLPELDQVTRPCKVKKVERNTFSIILTQGLNRQIRRMCEACGCQVKRLVRVRIMNIRLGNLRTGAYRQITKEEYEELTGLLKDSSSLSLKERKNQ